MYIGDFLDNIVETKKLVREIIENPDKIEIYLAKKQAFDLGWNIAGSDQHEVDLAYEDIKWGFDFLGKFFEKTTTTLSHTRFPDSQLTEKIIIKSDCSCLLQLKSKQITNFKENLFLYLFNLGVQMRIGAKLDVLDIPMSTEKKFADWNVTLIDLIDLSNSIDKQICLTSS